MTKIFATAKLPRTIFCPTNRSDKTMQQTQHKGQDQDWRGSTAHVIKQFDITLASLQESITDMFDTLNTRLTIIETRKMNFERC